MQNTVALWHNDSTADVIVFLPCNQFCTDGNLDISSMSFIIIFRFPLLVFMLFISQLWAEASE